MSLYFSSIASFSWNISLISAPRTDLAVPSSIDFQVSTFFWKLSAISRSFAWSSGDCLRIASKKSAFCWFLTDSLYKAFASCSPMIPFLLSSVSFTYSSDSLVITARERSLVSPKPNDFAMCKFCTSNGALIARVVPCIPEVIRIAPSIASFTLSFIFSQVTSSPFARISAVVCTSAVADSAAISSETFHPYALAAPFMNSVNVCLVADGPVFNTGAIILLNTAKDNVSPAPSARP